MSEQVQIPFHSVTPHPDAVPETPAMPPAEEAAMKFTQLLPYVRKLCATMSAKAQARVHYAMAEFPLGATKPRLLDDDERQLFHILQQLNGFKSTVIQSILQQQMELEKLKTQALEETGTTAAEMPAAEQEVNDGRN